MKFERNPLDREFLKQQNTRAKENSEEDFGNKRNLCFVWAGRAASN